LNPHRPALCRSGPSVSQCRRLALWPRPTGQPPSPSPIRPAARHGRAAPPVSGHCRPGVVRWLIGLPSLLLHVATVPVPTPILSPLLCSVPHARPLPTSIAPAPPAYWGKTPSPPCAAWRSCCRRATPLLPPRRAPFKRALPPSPAGFFPRAPITLPLRPRRRPCRSTTPLLRPPTTVGAALHENIAVSSRLLRPVVAPPPRCVLAGPALPDTSPLPARAAPAEFPAPHRSVGRCQLCRPATVRVAAAQ
jgi:hypothetical protein